MHTTIQTILALALALALGLSSQRSLAQEPAPPNEPAPPSEPLSKQETKTIQLRGAVEPMVNSLGVAARDAGVTMSMTGRSIILTGPPDGVLTIEDLARKFEQYRIGKGVPPFDLETGPTLGETLARIEAAFVEEGFVLNVVVTDPELLKLRMVKTKLRAVGFETVATLIPKLMVDQPVSFSIEVADDSWRGQPKSPHTESRVMLIERTVFPNQSSSTAVRQAPQSAVYKIDGTQRSIPNEVELIEKSQDSILAAIDTGLEVMGRSPEFQIKLHRPTGTIFVKGSPEELRMVHQVVELVAVPQFDDVIISAPAP